MIEVLKKSIRAATLIKEKKYKVGTGFPDFRCLVIIVCSTQLKNKENVAIMMLAIDRDCCDTGLFV